MLPLLPLTPLATRLLARRLGRLESAVLVEHLVDGGALAHGQEHLLAVRPGAVLLGLADLADLDPGGGHRLQQGRLEVVGPAGV